MRTLIILIIGVICCLGSCEKDPTVGGPPICKPQNRPEITDTGRMANQRLNGKWTLSNTKELGNQGYIDYDSLKNCIKQRALCTKPQLHFKGNRVDILLNFNKCLKGNYSIVRNQDGNWIKFTEKDRVTGCTRMGANQWERNYQRILANTTCYRLTNKRLVIQYYIGDSNKGKLIYKQVN